MSVGIKKSSVAGGALNTPPPPSEIKQNGATEKTCEGSKEGFLGMPDSTRPFPDGDHMYLTCIHVSIGSQSLTLISYPPKWVKNKYISKCLKCSETKNALKKKLSPGHFCPGDN